MNSLLLLTDEKLLTRFENLVSRVPFSGSVNIHKFSLRFCDFRYLSLLKFWVLMQLLVMLKRLNLIFFLRNCLKIFAFQKHMKFSSWAFIIFFCVAEKPFSICHVLEDLSMEICGHPVPNFNISSLTQKRLTFGIFINHPCLAKRNVMIRAPNLEPVYLDDYSLSFHTLLFLGEVYLHIQSLGMEIEVHHVLQLLQFISNVKFLYLSTSALQVSSLLIVTFMFEAFLCIFYFFFMFRFA